MDSPTLYSGTFERSMDAKKRVSVPSGWLTKGEGEVFYVVPHPAEKYLMVMPESEFAAWETRIQEAEGTSMAQKRIAIRRFYSEAHTVTTDKQGRILLNEKHCERAGLKGDVVFVGGRSRFEIWSRDEFEAALAKEDEAYRSVAESIGL